MSSGYRLIYHKAALKYSAKQEKFVQERIASGLWGLLEDPPIGDIKPMKGHAGFYRFRKDQQEKVIILKLSGLAEMLINE